MDLLDKLGKQKGISVNFIYWLFTGCLLSFLLDFDKTFGALYYLGTIIGIVVLCSSFFLPLKQILFPLLILLLVAKDTTQGADEMSLFGMVPSSTPWQIYISNIPPSFIILFFVVVIFIRLNRIKIRKRPPYLFIYFFGISILTSVLYGFAQQDFGRFFTDFKIPVFFFLGIGIFDSYFSRFPDRLLFISEIILALLAGRELCDFIYLITDFGQKLTVSNYLSFDSSKGLIIIFVFLALGKLIQGKELIKYVIIFAISFILLIAYQTRWLVVSAILGAIILFFSFSLKSKIKIFLVLIFFLGAIIPFLIYLFPLAFKLIGLRFSSITSLDTGSDINEVEIVRTASIINSVHTLWEKKALFTGLGYGSWFTDTYFPMLNLNESAFEEKSLSLGRYYRVHDFFFFFLMKFGLLGLILFIKEYLKPVIKMFKVRHVFNKSSNTSLLFIVLIGISPMILTSLYWTSKGLMIMAMFVIISNKWVIQTSNHINEI